MVSLYIKLPLTVLVLLSILSVVGLGSGSFGNVQVTTLSGSLYNSAGVAVFNSNLTCVYSVPCVLVQGGNLAQGTNSQYAYYTDGTMSTFARVYQLVQYPLYSDIHGQNQVYWSAIHGYANAVSVNIGGSIGLIAILIALVAIACIAGITVFGTGENESAINLVLKFTAWLSVWSAFSVLGFGILGFLNVPQFAFGDLLYFVFSVSFTWGVIDSFGHPSGSD